MEKSSTAIVEAGLASPVAIKGLLPKPDGAQEQIDQLEYALLNIKYLFIEGSYRGQRPKHKSLFSGKKDSIKHSYEQHYTQT